MLRPSCQQATPERTLFDRRLAATGRTLAALGAAFATFLAKEATAHSGQTALQATAAATLLSRRRVLLILHLLLRRISVAALLMAAV
jgi:hypothetical protein